MTPEKARRFPTAGFFLAGNFKASNAFSASA
jgi:hypothetical protein